jgi:hypothetical protein
LNGKRAMLRPRIVPAALAATAALLLVHAAISGCDHDEIEHLHAAWLVSQGERPFVDFHEIHHPTAYYLFAPLARATFGSPRALVFAARAVDLGVLALALLAFAAIARRTVATRAAWAPLLLLGCFFFVRNSMEVRNDPWMNALCLAGLWLWTGHVRDGSMRKACLAGLAFGCAIVFLQKAVAFAGLVAIGTALAMLHDRAAWRRTAVGAAAALGCAALPLLAAVAFVHREGYLRDLVYWCYSFTRHLYLQTAHRESLSALSAVGIAVLEDPVLWLGGIAGIAFAIRRSAVETTIAAVVAVGLLAGFFASRFPFGHNLLPVEACLAILAVPVVDAAVSSIRLRAAAAALVLAMVAKTAAMSTFYSEVPDAPAVQEAMLALSRAEDPIAAPPPYHPIFRRDAFYFWAVPGLFVPAYLQQCAREWCPEGKAAADARAWEIAPPVVVFAPPGEPTWVPWGFPAHLGEYTRVADGLFVRRAPAALSRTRG